MHDGSFVRAGLELFHREPAVLKTFEAMASGRILLAEILQRGPTPLMVLYDTSQDDDVNINAACMKALQDKSLIGPLEVKGRFLNNNNFFFVQLEWKRKHARL